MKTAHSRLLSPITAYYRQIDNFAQIGGSLNLNLNLNLVRPFTGPPVISPANQESKIPAQFPPHLFSCSTLPYHLV
jgi:hypothetical protein